MNKEEVVTGGLLSKMVRFVRNPTVDWGALDSIADAREENSYNKQMLKELLERKRNNDFVRRREFDQLRKLRQREMHGQRTEDPVARPSFFQSSVITSDEGAGDRAGTLKKIDEIEAQMAQQWWKSNQDPDTRPGDKPPDEPAYESTALVGMEAMSSPPEAFAPTASASLNALAGFRPVAPPLMADDAVDFGGPGAAAAPGSADHKPGHKPGTRQPAPAAKRAPAASAPPAPPAPQPAQEFVHDPDLEEAAILFANGDHAGAEADLLEVLARHQQNTPAQQIGTWMVLFDLYRAIGQRERFDSLSIDFAARYSRSAPLWFSMPEQAGIAVASPAGVAALRHNFNWSAPATLALSSVAALQASLDRATAPWPLSWARLTAIDDAAVSLLADHLSRWAERDGQFVFSGVEKLNALLEAKTPSGERSGNPEWWRLRMAVLRLMGLADDFELVALDYCVTYEMSPPSWVAPRCTYCDNEGVSSGAALLAAGGGMPAADGAGHEAGSAGQDADDAGHDADRAFSAPDSAPLAQLSGHVDGDATQLLKPLESFLLSGVPLAIACDKLIRMDFTAAGSVLNWAAGQQAQGHVLEFRNLQRLVAIFFNVVGINEHAWVLPRKD